MKADADSKRKNQSGWGNVPRWTLGALAFSRSAAAVYLVLATHASREWLAWPSVDTIIAHTGLERRAVQVALLALVKRGLIAVEQKGGGRRADGTGITTVYRLLTDGKGAPTNTVKGASGCAVNSASPGGATAHKRAKKGAPGCAQTDNRTYKTTTGATGAAAAAAGNHEFRSEMSDALPEPDPATQSQKRSSDKKSSKFSKSELESIYQAYPRKTAKIAALKAIGKALLVLAKRGTPDPVSWLLGRVQKFAASAAGQKGTYTPYPGTWMNKGMYDDDDREWAETDSRGQAASAARPRAEEGKYDHL